MADSAKPHRQIENIGNQTIRFIKHWRAYQLIVRSGASYFQGNNITTGGATVSRSISAGANVSVGNNPATNTCTLWLYNYSGGNNFLKGTIYLTTIARE